MTTHQRRALRSHDHRHPVCQCVQFSLLSSSSYFHIRLEFTSKTVCVLFVCASCLCMYQRSLWTLSTAVFCVIASIVYYHHHHPSETQVIQNQNQPNNMASERSMLFSDITRIPAPSMYRAWDGDGDGHGDNEMIVNQMPWDYYMVIVHHNFKSCGSIPIGEKNACFIFLHGLGDVRSSVL